MGGGCSCFSPVRFSALHNEMFYFVVTRLLDWLELPPVLLAIDVLRCSHTHTNRHTPEQSVKAPDQLSECVLGMSQRNHMTCSTPSECDSHYFIWSSPSNSLRTRVRTGKRLREGRPFMSCLLSFDLLDTEPTTQMECKQLH